MGRRRLCLVLTAAALIGAALSGCGGGPGAAEATPTPIPTAVVPSKPTYTVERGTVIEEVKFTGRIAPVEEEQLYFRVDGRVAMVNVKQGDKVKVGDILAELEIDNLLNALAQAEVGLQTAQLQLEAAQQTSAEQRTRLEINLQMAKLRLEQAKVHDPAPSVAIAAANRQKAAAELQRAQAAYDHRAVSPGVSASWEAANLQQATLDYEIAEAQYQLALQSQKAHEYELQMLQQSVRLAELDLQELGGTVDPVLEQQVARAQLEVDRLKAEVASARLIAPIDGEVTMVGAYAGRTVSAYRPVVNVAAPEALEVSADLTSETMQKLSIGQECKIVIVNYPAKEFHGKVRRLPYPYGTGGSTTAGTAEEDRSTRVSIDDADVTLEKGALVRVTVVLQQKDDVLWLPPAAVRTFQGKDFVLVLDGEGQRRVPVKLGIKAEDRVEILSGVEEGQVVVGP
ncbi:MAG: efflux RND transporter periplasmic adaptor subunit [Anaerolineae bacterium]|nr:efflux RND transporter periplasmic adaptor subunit [Anaerolineae bacterium]